VDFFFFCTRSIAVNRLQYQPQAASPLVPQQTEGLPPRAIKKLPLPWLAIPLHPPPAVRIHSKAHPPPPFLNFCIVSFFSSAPRKRPWQDFLVFRLQVPFARWRLHLLIEEHPGNMVVDAIFFHFLFFLRHPRTSRFPLACPFY